MTRAVYGLAHNMGLSCGQAVGNMARRINAHVIHSNADDLSDQFEPAKRIASYCFEKINYLINSVSSRLLLLLFLSLKNTLLIIYSLSSKASAHDEV